MLEPTVTRSDTLGKQAEVSHLYSTSICQTGETQTALSVYGSDTFAPAGRYETVMTAPKK